MTEQVQLCRNCLHVLDAHTSSTSSDNKQQPSEGDLSVCWYCGTLSAFDKNLNLVPVTKEQQKALEADDPTLARLITKLSEAIKDNIKKN